MSDDAIESTPSRASWAPTSRSRWRSLELVGAALIALALPAAGTEVRVLKADTQAAFLSGTLEGVAVDRLGSIELADAVDRLTAFGEPFAFSAVAVADGWVIGTGSSGKVLRVDSRGEVEELFAASEPEIFALTAFPDGTVYAASSPDGKVYRLKDGRAEPLFDPESTYIWALARAADGALLVATGTEGKLFRVDPKTGKGNLIYDSSDTHLRSLLPLADGSVVIGTAGEGLVLRLLPAAAGAAESWRPQTLYDAREPEVVALTADPAGNWYAAILASESSFVDLSRPKPATESAEGKDAADGEEAPAAAATVEVADGTVPPSGSRLSGATGPRSLLLRIAPTGVVETLWSFDSETVHAIAWHADRLWVATGLEGKLYSYDGSSLVLQVDVEERQLVALLPGPIGKGPRTPSFVSTNAAALFRPTGAARRAGTYTSPVLDTAQIARFGTLHWDGDLPEGAAVRWSFRSGLSSEPDETWSPWVVSTNADSGAREHPVGELPRGRYVQWKAELSAGKSGASPRIAVVELSFRQENLRPKIESFGALEPGQVLVPSNFNPGSQVYEPVAPDREGMFQVLVPAPEADSGGRLKPLWKKGWRTVRWKASDPNGDSLRFRLEVRPETGAGPAATGSDDAGWLRVGEDDLSEDHLSFDATALPDGLYRFRVTANDRHTNTPASTLTTSRTSEVVLIDHTPPVVGVSRREASGRVMRVEVRDARSPLRRAEVAIDGGEWLPAVTADGLLDGRSETLVVDVPEAAKLVLVRVMDAAWNLTTAALIGGEGLGSSPEGQR